MAKAVLERELEKELEKNRGKWVAIRNGQVVVGLSADQVYNQIKRRKEKVELIKKVPSIGRAELLF